MPPRGLENLIVFLNLPKGWYFFEMKMKICKIEGCKREFRVKGYCMKHYQNLQQTGHPLGKFKGDKKALSEAISKRNTKYIGCKVLGCENKHYAKGYCCNHWHNLSRSGNPLGKHKKCLISGCNVFVIKKDYCVRHLFRIKHKLPIDLSIKCYPKGKENYQWKGGIFEYPNHYLMKKNRLIILKKEKGICEICKKKGVFIHHKDGSKDNHNLDNLILLCHQCHGLMHKGRKNKTSKFIRLYGYTFIEIVNRLNLSSGYIYNLHKKNKLFTLLTKS